MAPLAVYLAAKRVGTLSEGDKPGAYLFQYAGGLADARPGDIVLSASLPVREEPYLPDRATPFFDGLLPELGVREAVARNLKISEQNTFGLLAALGRDCAGAVILLPEHEELSDQGSVEWLDDRALDRLIQDLPTTPLGVSGSSKVRLSLAGLQRKAVVVRSGTGSFGLPNESAPSSHLIKPQYPDTAHNNLVYNEHFCMRVAKCVGLDVAHTDLIFIGERPCLLVERFDRSTDGTNRLRLHQEDLCQALGVPPGRKYENEGGPGLSQACALLRDVSYRAGADVLSLVRAVAVNFVLGNSDAHSKNFALLYGEAGIQLAPGYDLVSTIVYPEIENTLAMAIGEEYVGDRISSDDLGELARRCGLNARQLLDEWRAVAARTAHCAEQVAELMRAERLHVPVIDRIVEVARKRAEQV
jgi:serine/threonine-protein kinase HipA